MYIPIQYNLPELPYTALGNLPAAYIFLACRELHRTLPALFTKLHGGNTSTYAHRHPHCGNLSGIRFQLSHITLGFRNAMSHLTITDVSSIP